jgi:broad specificity phosphatase PhoE
MNVTRGVTLMVLLSLIAGVRLAAAEQVIFLVRHAERADAAATPAPAGAHSMLGDDPPLTAAGEQRAVRLAATLAQAGITDIVTTEFKRTRQTAAPLAEKLKITPIMSAAKDPGPLVARLKNAKAPVLVVGHANTLPDVIKALGVAEPVAIGDNDYDNLFIVVRAPSGKATLIRLKY